MSLASFDVIVVGLGHAGCEAALACARQGLSTLGITLREDRIAVMSCNPAIGGTAKGHLVRELDALGGEMAAAADDAGTHFRTLNGSRGPAVQATRVLCDRDAYALRMQAAVRAQPHLTIWEGEAVHLEVEDGTVRGVRMADGREAGGLKDGTVRGVRMADGREAGGKAVILTTGTFLRALMHEGSRTQVGGRIGDGAAVGLSAVLGALGFRLGRFKTGTPARLLAASIDWDACQAQPGEGEVRPFSERSRHAQAEGTVYPRQPPVSCAITWTTAQTHQVLRENLGLSPLYSGRLEGRGPRYCPSLEDKVVRFASRERHQVFLEPEGPNSPLVYPAGLSTSLPAEIQLAFLRTIPGLERVEVARYGYAVEYDFAHPTQLEPTLETRAIRGLYFAGQLNGTSGYEEAAVQGLLAGLNAALRIRGAPPLVLRRDEAHAGVLIDELVQRGVDEPFRMLTSRSEHRLALREGNAPWRLAEAARRGGLLSAELLERAEATGRAVEAEVSRLRAAGLANRLKQATVDHHLLRAEGLLPADLPAVVAEEAEVVLKYEGYLLQAQRAAKREREAGEGWRIPESLDWRTVRGLSKEAIDRLEAVRPRTVGQAREIPGVSAAAVSLVLVHLERLRRASGGSACKPDLGPSPG